MWSGTPPEAVVVALTAEVKLVCTHIQERKTDLEAGNLLSRDAPGSAHVHSPKEGSSCGANGKALLHSGAFAEG